MSMPVPSQVSSELYIIERIMVYSQEQSLNLYRVWRENCSQLYKKLKHPARNLGTVVSNWWNRKSSNIFTQLTRSRKHKIED